MANKQPPKKKAVQYRKPAGEKDPARTTAAGGSRKRISGKPITKNTAKIKARQKENKKRADLNAYKRKRRIEGQKYVSGTSVLVLSIVAIAVLIIIGNSVMRALQHEEIATIAVEFGAVDLPTVLNAAIIRDEHVYESPSDGRVIFNYNDLERVKTGTFVCSVQNEQFVDEMNDNLNVISEEILELQKKRGEISGFSQDVKRTNRQIQENIDNARRRFLDANIASVYALRENIERNIMIRNNMLLSDNRGSVKSLVSDKDDFEEKLSKGVVSVQTNESGVLSYSVDGSEKLFSIENLDTLTPEHTRMTLDGEVLQRKTAVKANEPIFKIIKSNQWFIAVYAPKEIVFDYKANQDRTIFIERDNAYIPFKMTVDKIIEGDKTNYIVFSTNNNLLDFIDLRFIKIKLSNSGHEGFKIPSATIVEKTYLKVPNEYVNKAEQPFVIRKGAQFESTQQYENVPINIKDEDEDFTYVYQELNKGLTLGDVIVNGEDKTKETAITQILNVKGVFILNKGYSDFVRIQLSDDVPEKDGFVILDTALNKYLRINDKIIYDTKSLIDGQKILNE